MVQPRGHTMSPFGPGLHPVSGSAQGSAATAAKLQKTRARCQACVHGVERGPIAQHTATDTHTKSPIDRSPVPPPKRRTDTQTIPIELLLSLFPLASSLFPFPFPFTPPAPPPPRAYAAPFPDIRQPCVLHSKS
jgi:hypothetical protein